MSRVAVIGAGVRVSGYELAGALICVAAGPEETREAWAALAPDVEVVILTPEAARWLGGVPGPAGTPAGLSGLRPPRGGILAVVLPP